VICNNLLLKDTITILIDDFVKVYFSIFREKKTTINLAACSKKDFLNCLMSEGIKANGGINTILEMIENFKLRNLNLRKEIFSRLKKEVKRVSMMDGFSDDENYTGELNEKFMRGCAEFRATI
jgi:hypothetical protein